MSLRVFVSPCENSVVLVSDHRAIKSRVSDGVTELLFCAVRWCAVDRPP
jgi:hypothetical protein